MRRQDGFTLLELLISSVVLLVVVVGLTQAFVVQQETYAVVDSVAEAQQNLRAITDLIERDVRRAGYLVARPGAICGYDATAASDTLFVSNSDAVDTVLNLEAGDPDDSDVSGDFGVPINLALGTVLTGVRAVTLAQTWLDVAANGTDFAQNAGILILDRNDPSGRVACGTITSAIPVVAPFTITVSLGNTSIGPTTTASQVVAIPARVYRIVQPAAGSPLQLLRDGQLLAEDVEDFQLSYFFDLNQDGNVDPGERFAAAGGVAQPFEIGGPPDGSLLREVRINLVTVTRADDPSAQLHSLKGMGQATENRSQASLPAADGRRRRVHSAAVRLRNL